jgi:hypothetical protein
VSPSTIPTADSTLAELRDGQQALAVAEVLAAGQRAGRPGMWPAARASIGSGAPRIALVLAGVDDARWRALAASSGWRAALPATAAA